MLTQIVGEGEPERVAIIDWEPKSQVTYGEFCYTLDMLWRRRRHPGRDRRSARIQDAGRQNPGEGHAVDRILNRLTLLDWGARHDETRALHPHLVGIPGDLAYHPYLWSLGTKSPSRFSPTLDPGEDGAIVLGG